MRILAQIGNNEVGKRTRKGKMSDIAVPQIIAESLIQQVRDRESVKEDEENSDKVD